LLIFVFSRDWVNLFEHFPGNIFYFCHPATFWRELDNKPITILLLLQGIDWLPMSASKLFPAFGWAFLFLFPFFFLFVATAHFFH